MIEVKVEVDRLSPRLLNMLVESPLRVFWLDLLLCCRCNINTAMSHVQSFLSAAPGLH